MSSKQPRPGLAALVVRGGRAAFALGTLATAAAGVPWPHAALAQSYARLDLGGAIEAGGEAERYARVLQLAGLVPLTPWSIQPFSPSQHRLLRPTRPHPWAQRFDQTSSADSASVGTLQPSARLIGNSTFPFQVSGGPTWAGRGLTAEAQGGVRAQWGSIYAQAAPLAFVAQNASFDLAPNGRTGIQRFADARYPVGIDAPQRFGNSAYARIAPGNSSLVIDAKHVVMGLSSAPQQWGPDREYPLVLGPNAGGFPSVYIGSSAPWNFWLFRAHARLVYGELGQSAYAAPDTGDRRRLASGLVVVAEPRGLPGLEIGLSRFIHRPWGDFSAAALGRPFSGIISVGRSTVNERFENQNASAFARWALPGAKAEFYGEFYKEDYPGALHQSSGSLVESPDDYAAFAIGFQHLFVAGDSLIRVLRAELVNAETAHQQRLERGFTVPLPPYIHSAELQGHTENGLILGSPEAYGGAAWTVGVDEYSARGRRSLMLQRQLRLDWLPGIVPGSGLVHPDVIYDVRAELLRFNGAREIGVTLIPALDLNRNLIAHHDMINITAAISARGWR